MIWADRFNIDGDGLMTSRREIALQIAYAIASQVERNETQRKTYETNVGSYRSFLLGQRYLKQLNLPEVRRARKSFRESLYENSDFAPAMSGLARSYFFEWLLTARGDSELLALAERHARDAVGADDTLATGYRELGVVKLYLRQFDESMEYHDKAEALSPQHANVIASYADTLVQASRPEGRATQDPGRARPQPDRAGRIFLDRSRRQLLARAVRAGHRLYRAYARSDACRPAVGGELGYAWQQEEGTPIRPQDIRRASGF